MEIKVWVEGIPKTVCGVSKDTTCRDVVKALAYATGKMGRFVLVERWGPTEKPLAPTDHLLNLLQQKGEYWHAVQFILRKTDGPVASPAGTTESLSPLPRPGREIPFQRCGVLRKSLTSHGTEFSVPPKIVTLRSGVLADKSNALIKENNFPSDLIGLVIPSPGTAVESTKQTKGKENAQPRPLVPIIPYGSDVPLQEEETKRTARHGRQASLDNQSHSSQHKLTHGTGTLDGRNSERAAESRLKEKKRQFAGEIQQQTEQMTRTQKEEMHFDREILMWEEKSEKLAREIELMEASIQPLRLSEKSVINDLKELSALQLEDFLRAQRKAEESLKSQLSAIRSKIGDCQDSVGRTEAKARNMADQMKRDRDLHEGYVQQAEVSLREERDRLVREVQHLTVIQESQSRRLEDIGLHEQRMDSTLLAKQLELDSLQGNLKKANFDGFLGGLSVKPTETSPDPLPDPETIRSMIEIFDGQSSLHVLENKPSPAAPARKGASSQRILVLKRNSTREGMWV